MVRVTQPSGGVSNMDSVPPRSPKTVRVLKPPGGGSSICFGEEDVPTPKAKPSTASNGSSAEDTASESSNGTAVNNSPVNASNGGDSANISAADSCSNGDSSNGTAAATESHKEISAPAAADTKAEADTKSEGTPTASTNGSGEVVTVTSGDSSPVVSKTPTNATNGSSESTTTASTPADNDSNESNGSPNKVSSKPSTPEPSSSTKSPSPATTPTPPSPGCTSPDTKDRLFGATAAIKKAPVVRATPPNHHMRSSIFTGEDEGPSVVPEKIFNRSASSPNGEKKPEVPRQAAPIRVRQPPGGHATKLW